MHKYPTSHYKSNLCTAHELQSSHKFDCPFFLWKNKTANEGKPFVYYKRWNKIVTYPHYLVESDLAPPGGLSKVIITIIVRCHLWCPLLDILFCLAKLNLSSIGAKLKRTDGFWEVGGIRTDGDEHARLKDKTHSLETAGKLFTKSKPQ